MAIFPDQPVFVGRDRERQQLLDAVERAVEGQGGPVLVSGEAGIGKTSLLDDLTYRVAGRDLLILSGGAYEVTATPPYGPWVEIIRAFPEGVDCQPSLTSCESAVESRELQPPAIADAPVAGYWSPSARPGQRMRIDDALSSFRDAQGNELGNLLTNISGILLGISDEVHVEPGQPVAEIGRPLA